MSFRFQSILGLLLLAGFSPAADWPQWRGPNRDGHSADTGLLKTWPKDGPKLLWTFKDAGLGYSGSAIVGNTLFSCGGDDKANKEFCYAIDLATGKELWRTDFGTWFKNAWGGGPRCTPTVAGGFVYVLGAKGDIACLNAKNGKLIWNKNLVKELKGKLMAMWGYSESVLLDGDQVVCSPGGSEGTLAALDAKTGAVRWRSDDVSDQASYSSIVVSEGGGHRHYVQLTATGVIGVDPKTGKLLWRVDGEGFSVAVIPTAVVKGDHAFATTDYGAKCMTIKLSADGAGKVKAEKLFSNKNLENHHGGVILVDERLYGSQGSASGKKTLPFVCMNFISGEVIWKKAGTLEPSAIAYADGDLYCYGQQTGTLVRLKASPTEYAVDGTLTIPQETERRLPQGAIWTHPVIGNGRLILRDQDLIFCYDLRPGTAAQ